MHAIVLAEAQSIRLIIWWIDIYLKLKNLKSRVNIFLTGNLRLLEAVTLEEEEHREEILSMKDLIGGVKL